MINRVYKNKDKLMLFIEKSAIKSTRWIGSTQSLIFHTLLFLSFFIAIVAGVPANTVMLVLTTIVSLEAIYLSIFIQMSVNRQAKRLHAVSKDVHEIQEDMEEIQKDVEGIEEDIEEIQKDVEEISEDIEGIEKDVDEIQKDVEEISDDVEGIEKDIDEIQEDVEELHTDEETENNIVKTKSTKEESLEILLNELKSIKKEINSLKKEIKQNPKEEKQEETKKESAIKRLLKK